MPKPKTIPPITNHEKVGFGYNPQEDPKNAEFLKPRGIKGYRFYVCFQFLPVFITYLAIILVFILGLTCILRFV